MERESTSSMPAPRLRWIGLLLFAVGAIGAGLFFLHSPAPTTVAVQPDHEPPAAPLFQGWGKPDLAIVVSGEMHGYLQPCGCSHPQKGGMARRYNFLESLKAKSWQVLAVDLGDIAAPQGPMTLLKYTTSMRALQLMRYSAIGTGERELTMPLHEALGAFALNNDKPRTVALNLLNTATANDVFHMLNARQYEIIASKPKIGIMGVVGPDVAKDVRVKLPANEPDIKFGNNGQLVGPAMAAMAPLGVEFGVMLYQGSEKKALDCAEFCHDVATKKKLPPVRLILCLADNAAPPSVTIKSPKAPETHIVSIGHKGIYVGVVGFFKKGKSYDVKYQLVEMGPEYENKAGQEKANQVSQLMEEYAKEVKDKDYLAKSSRSMHQTQVAFKGAEFVGSQECKACHPHAYAVWQKTAHFKAFQTLQNAKNPSLRHFDPDCVKCHTVGFDYKTGYYDPPQGAPLAVHNAKLLGVGCESCHGPGSAHIDNTKDKDIHKTMNPFSKKWKPAVMGQAMWDKERIAQMDYKHPTRSCQTCHDQENDVNWGKFDFIKDKWMKIDHVDPKKNNVANDKGPVIQIVPPKITIDPQPEAKEFPKGDPKKDE